MNWDYLQPVKIIFGKGKVREIGKIAEELGCKKGLLITGPFFIKSGQAEKMIKESKGLLKAAHGDISPNPDVEEVDRCAKMIREEGIDFIVALGGGSSMDAAKAAATIALTEDSIRKYHGTGEKVPQEHLPLIAIPTTAGTGIDVLSHAIEGYWSKGHQPICDALAIHAADLVFQYLYKAYKNPTDEEAREKMCEASVIAGLAFTLPKTTSSHACSFPLTNLHHIPHGEACGLTLDYFARINKDADGGRVLELAKKLGFEDVDAMADAIHDLKASMGLRNDLKDLHLDEEQIAELVKISRHPNLYNNPVEITDEMLLEMYEKLC